MTSPVSEGIKERLPKFLVNQAQQTLDILPHMDRKEEMLFWSTLALSFQAGRAEAADEQYQDYLKTLKSSRTEIGGGL